ncbi:signal peptidase I [Glaciihabitans tibetensis]|uniref:Signal peptidase I n=1 Tax=Glaciihabitans tibetensis TaxID=1266600 RepID=A0A2T0VAD2_9MICO|nr:signal peptidase I [Glaciihabitans tibetensis]PRY67155.1 signal peptidase I [Glaciihabitans tibetensis]
MSSEESPGATKTTGDDEPRARGLPIFLRDLAIIIVAALVISFGVKTFLARTFYIPSPSMNNTLIEDDRVIVNQLVPDLIPLSRGDVVVFTDPADWLTGPTPEPVSPIGAVIGGALSVVGLGPTNDDHLIKRVIGLPGDTVVCCTASGQLSINGVQLTEPYIEVPPGSLKVTPADFEVTVPDGMLWVMGDNRYNSGDSAFHRLEPSGGFVPVSNVVGRAFVISWPANRWTLLDNYPETFGGIDQ